MNILIAFCWHLIAFPFIFLQNISYKLLFVEVRWFWKISETTDFLKKKLQVLHEQMQHRGWIFFLDWKFKFYSSIKEVEIFTKDEEIWHLTGYRIGRKKVGRKWRIFFADYFFTDDYFYQQLIFTDEYTYQHFFTDENI